MKGGGGGRHFSFSVSQLFIAFGFNHLKALSLSPDLSLSGH